MEDSTMDPLTARPQILKQANLSLLRKTLKDRGTATRSELVAQTGISSTTVRTLLLELMERGEIEAVGRDPSSGGRKAGRYRLRADACFGAAFCIRDSRVECLLVNACGEIVRSAPLEVSDGDTEGAILDCLDALTRRQELKSIGLGVPGAVDGLGYWRKSAGDGDLHRSDLGNTVFKRYGIPVVMENDQNATTLGFGRCYAKEFPQEDPENINMAYLHFEKDCVGAGLIAGGKLIRGFRNFAGELGLVPLDGEDTLDDLMARELDEGAYTRCVIQIVSWVCALLNPQYVALGGPSFRKECLGPIGDGLSALLPTPLFAEILYAPEVLHDYYDGMAYLTAKKMFDEVQFVTG